MDRRRFVRTGLSAAAMSALDASSLHGSPISKGDAPSLPLLSVDESARLGEKLGIAPPFATSNVFRGLLQSQTAAAGFCGFASALLFHNKVKSRARELIILRIGWRTGSEYVFCNHVPFSRELGMPDEEILGCEIPSAATLTATATAACSASLTSYMSMLKSPHRRGRRWRRLSRLGNWWSCCSLLVFGEWRPVSSRARRFRLMRASPVGRKAGRQATENRSEKGLLYTGFRAIKGSNKMGVPDGKVAIIAGGTSGIGGRTAESFVHEGARVVIAGRRRERGEELADRLGAAASFIGTDVSIEDNVAAMIKHAVDAFGRLDCLFNNAGDASAGIA
jgi:hypothetical protein